MRTQLQFYFLMVIVAILSSSFRVPIRTANKLGAGIMMNTESSGAGESKRKRRIKSNKGSPKASYAAIDPPLEDNLDITQIKSKLTPLTGTLEAKRLQQENKNAAQRYLEDLFEPPSRPGEEPKTVKLIKSVTWFAVIALVLVEIYVSIRTGGMPFDASQAKI